MKITKNEKECIVETETTKVIVNVDRLKIITKKD